MRTLRVGAGFVGAALIALAANTAAAGPLERDASSKPLGNYTGRDLSTSRNQNQAYRAYSYQPQTTQATVKSTEPAKQVESPQPSEASKADVATAPKQNNNQVRSFSYQSVPATQYYAPRRTVTDPRFNHAERKALGEY